MTSGGRTTTAAIVIAAAGVLGFFGYRFLAARRAAGQPSERALVAALARSEAPSGAQAAKPAASAAGLGARVPEQLPDLGFPDRKGTVRHLADWRGRPLVVNFWATWCGPCRREIPLLERLERSHAAEHLQVVGIAVDDRAAVLKYANAMKIDYPVLIGGENGGLQAIDALGMADVLPFTVFADGRGRILTVKVGELHPDGANLILEKLAAVDAGHLTVSTARQQIAQGLRSLAIARARAAPSAPKSTPAGTSGI